MKKLTLLILYFTFSLTLFAQASGGEITRKTQIPSKNQTVTHKSKAYIKRTVYTYSEPIPIDLGLPSGTLWGDRNVGANKPEEGGYTFCWGDAKPSNSITKEELYGENSKFSQPYNAKVLNLEDDAAHVNLGNCWRTPSSEQLRELVNNSYTEMNWGKQKGTYGLIIISRKNGNKLFLPVGKSNTDHGYYWTADLFNDKMAYSLVFTREGIETEIGGLFWSARWAERYIRPVQYKSPIIF